jgi:hypothetical protein
MRWFTTAVALLAITSFAKAQDGTYATAAAKAFAERKPLVVFIGVTPRSIDGASTIQVPSLEGYDRGTIVVSKPGASWLQWAATLPASASDDEISSKAIGARYGSPVGAVEALDEVNAVRAARGLPPYAKDDGLTQAAMSAARFRADRRMDGHTPSDFAHLPAGSNATAAGCAAWSPDMGWGSCCTYENWTTAGAAYVVGDDGRRYMHLFVR